MRALASVRHVSKRYRLGTGVSGLRGALAAAWRGRAPVPEHWAVRDVSFDVMPGEALGIIGPNGSGKTTLLKLLSRVTTPTEGTVGVRGRLSALVELGAGFHPDLTGRENIYLNGVLLGLERREIDERFDEIVEFAGVGDFLDTPVKRYSSGMYARLGFATAAHTNPDVLLVDEVLAVGDYAFQVKCHERMERLRAGGTALILVSHDFDLVRRACTRGLVMYRGRPLYTGSAHEAVAAYSQALRDAARGAVRTTVPREGGLEERAMTLDAEVERVELLDDAGQPASVLRSGTTARVRMEVVFHERVNHPAFGFFVFTEDGRPVYVTNTRWMQVPTRAFAAGERCTVEFSWKVALLGGTYELGVDVPSAPLTHFHDRIERALTFSVVRGAGAEGIADLEGSVCFSPARTDVAEA